MKVFLLVVLALGSAKGMECDLVQRSGGVELRVCDLKIRIWKGGSSDSAYVVTGHLVANGEPGWRMVGYRLTFKDGKSKGKQASNFTRDLEAEFLQPDIPYSFREVFVAASPVPVEETAIDFEILPKSTFATEAALSKRNLERAKIEDQRRAARRSIEQKQFEAVPTRCAAVFSGTSNKKISDLTVIESQSIDACRALGLYKPGSPAIARPATKVQ